jgi:hypothetical protein
MTHRLFSGRLKYVFNILSPLKKEVPTILKLFTQQLSIVIVSPKLSPLVHHFLLAPGGY